MSDYFSIRKCSNICTIMSRNSLALEKIYHKCFQCPCKCVNWHQTIYVRNTHVQHRIYFRRVPYCSCWAWIGSFKTNFAQHISSIIVSKVDVCQLFKQFWAVPHTMWLMIEILSGDILLTFIISLEEFNLIIIIPWYWISWCTRGDTFLI